MDNTKFEINFMEEVKLLLSSLENEFKIRNIKHSVQITSNDEKFENYSSEIEIVFNKGGDFIDIIEFFVIKNGKVNVDSTTLKDLLLDFHQIISNN